MLWIGYLLAQCVFGFELLIFLSKSKHKFIGQISIAIPFGITTSNLIYFICSTILSSNIMHCIIHLVGLCVISFILHMSKREEILAFFKLFEKKHIIRLVVSLVISGFLLYHMYLPIPKTFQADVSNDINEEVSLIYSFIYGCNRGLGKIFKIRHPYCYKCVAQSRWMTALHSSILMNMFASLKQAMVAPSFLLIASFCFTFLDFSSNFLKHEIAIYAALLSCIFAGGLGFVSLLFNHNNLNKDMIRNRIKDVTEWSHPTLQYLIAKRPSQLSLAISISVIYLIMQKDPGLFIIAGALVGMLTSVQHQAFFAMLAYSAVYLLITFPFGTRKRAKSAINNIIFFAIGIAAGAAVPILQYLRGSNNSPLFVRGMPSAPLIPRGIFFASIVYWLQALGLFFIFSVCIAPFTVEKKINNILIPGIACMLIGSLVRFQDDPQRNIMFFYPGFMITASVGFIGSLWAIGNKPKTEEGKGAAAAWLSFVFLCSILSSLAGLYFRRNIKSGFGEQEQEIAKWLIANTPKNAVIAALPAEWSPVMLAGRVMYSQNSRFLEQVQKRIDKKAGEYNLILKNATYMPRVRYLIAPEKMTLIDPRWKALYSNKKTAVFTIE